jgi:hypothetical protein
MYFSFNALPSVKSKSRASKRALYKQVSNELSLGRVYLWLFIIAFTLAITLGHWLNQQGLEGEPLGYSILVAAFLVWQLGYWFILNTIIATKVRKLLNH